MADRSEKVAQMVERELKKDPNISNQKLYDKAKKLDRSIGKLSLRQFHARYPLQVKRRKGSKSRKRSRRAVSRKAELNRPAVRKVLMSLAEDIAKAEGKAEVIKILARLDSYVDKVEAAAAS